MKIVIRLLLPIIFIFSTVFTQQHDSKAFGVSSKHGIGFAFTSWPTLLQTNNYTGLTIVFPYLMNDIFFEPEISYYANDYQYDNVEMSNVSVRLLVGLFIHDGKDNFYVGTRLGVVFEAYGDDSEQETDHAFLIVPTSGGQYFLSDNFSIGGEYSVVVMNTLTPERTKMIINTVSRLTIRHYF